MHCNHQPKTKNMSTRIKFFTKLSLLSLAGMLAATIFTSCEKQEFVVYEPKENLTFDIEGVEFTMIFVRGGSFTMGSDEGGQRDRPTHSVTLINDFYIAETEVTQELYKKIMGYLPTSEFPGINNPVDNISWDNAQEFIKRLNEKLNNKDLYKHYVGVKFTLPTEAQWEYAAKGGNSFTNDKYSGSSNVDEVAWYTANSDQKTHPVKSLKPNELGIYDMSGNVSEFCQDWYGPYGEGSQTDPRGPADGTTRIIRGGNFGNTEKLCTITARDSREPSAMLNYLGLRLALIEWPIDI